ncbi:hypothetical protein PMAYCL1PPCAC_28552, partial [Pristionchus mayeri]
FQMHPVGAWEIHGERASNEETSRHTAIDSGVERIHNDVHSAYSLYKHEIGKFLKRALYIGLVTTIVSTIVLIITVVGDASTSVVHSIINACLVIISFFFGQLFIWMFLSSDIYIRPFLKIEIFVFNRLSKGKSEIFAARSTTYFIKVIYLVEFTILFFFSDHMANIAAEYFGLENRIQRTNKINFGYNCLIISIVSACSILFMILCIVYWFAETARAQKRVHLRGDLKANQFKCKRIFSITVSHIETMWEVDGFFHGLVLHCLIFFFIVMCSMQVVIRLGVIDSTDHTSFLYASTITSTYHFTVVILPSYLI